MPPAARLGDNHVCPKVEPGPVPHVGGPVIAGEGSVIIGYQPAARVGDSAQCVPAVDSISAGESSVTIGYKGAGKSDHWPELGNDIYVGAGAKLIGDIRIGDGCIVGANTVVTKDVPPRTRVVGAAVRMSPLEPG